MRVHGIALQHGHFVCRGAKHQYEFMPTLSYSLSGRTLNWLANHQLISNYRPLMDLLSYAQLPASKHIAEAEPEKRFVNVFENTSSLQSDQKLMTKHDVSNRCLLKYGV